MRGQVDYRSLQRIAKRIRLCDYLTVAQLYLQDNFLLERDLAPDDIKPRLLGHWGTCHGINVAYANLLHHFGRDDFTFILGPGHGFPALQANLFVDGELAKIDAKASKIGYEIPFTREFYKYVAPRKSDEIFAHLQELEQQESALMAKILNKQ